ncbi:hypothetical protein DPSP01_014806 [Paraphaeosphaeria sporulosa]
MSHLFACPNSVRHCGKAFESLAMHPWDLEIAMVPGRLSSFGHADLTWFQGFLLPPPIGNAVAQWLKTEFCSLGTEPKSEHRGCRSFAKLVEHHEAAQCGNLNFYLARNGVSPQRQREGVLTEQRLWIGVAREMPRRFLVYWLACLCGNH